MGAHKKQIVLAKEFVELHGAEFGLDWDSDASHLREGPRGTSGESRGRRENTSNFFRSGRTPGQPSAIDAYGPVEVAEAVAKAVPLRYEAGRDLLKVMSVVCQLEPQLREVIEERFYEGRTLGAIASDRDLSYQAVQSRIRTALRLISQHLSHGE